MKHILAFILLSFLSLYAIDSQVKIIDQKDCPVKITSYKAEYKERGQYTTEGIHHNVEYTNASDKLICAVQIGLVSFSIWNEFLSRTNGTAIEDIKPGVSKKSGWVVSPYADFLFLTGISYVSKVRFFDGTIWSADLEAIATELQKTEKTFNVEKLKEEEKGSK